VFGTTFYYGTIKKYVTLFGTLFNDVWINRTNSSTGKVVQSLKIPLSYGPKDKFIARVEMDPDLDKEFGLILPRMGFELLSYEYDPERKLNTISKFIQQDRDGSPNIRKFQYNPVPYNLNFQLSILVKNTEDGLMILEQILPFFTPEWNATVQLITDPDIAMDIPIYLNSVNVEDVYQGSFEERRVLTYVLDFTLKGYLFGPTKRQGIITLANTNLFIEDSYDVSMPDFVANVASNNTVEGARVTVYPGLTASGNGTTDAAQTVPRSTISANTDYDYIVVIDDPEITD